MIIYGIGTDIVNVKRIEKIMQNNIIFKKRIFSKEEIILCEKKNKKYSCYANRFASKEAFSKALGIGISKGLNFNEITVTNNKSGKPLIKIKGKSLQIVYKILKKKKFKTFLSISDESPFSISTIILTI
jgi:holo-[acyl-carrier protein] synthase